MDNLQASRPSLRDFCLVLFRHKWSILLISTSAILTVLIGLYIWPERYEARATLLVKLGRSNSTLSSIASPHSERQILTMGVRKEDLNTEIEILRNRRLIERMIDQLGLTYLFPKPVPPQTFFKRVKYEIRRSLTKLLDMIMEILYFLDLKKRLSKHDAAVETISKNLSAAPIKESDVIEVKLRWFSPTIAQTVLATLIDLYLDDHLEIHRASGAYEFLQKQVDALEKKLKSSEEQLRMLKEKKNITSFSEQRRLLLAELARLEGVWKDTSTQIAETQTKLNELSTQLASQPEYVEISKDQARNPILDTLKQRLLELQLERMKLESKLARSTRPIEEITRKIEEVKQRLAEENANVLGRITTGINTVYQETQKEFMLREVELKALKVKQEAIQNHIRSYQQELQRLREADLELKRLERQIKLDEEHYLLYRKKLEESRISKVLDDQHVINVKIVEPAVASLIPVSPAKKPLIFGVGIIISILGALGVAFLLEYLDHSLRTPEDVKTYLDLPVIASIQEFKALQK